MFYKSWLQFSQLSSTRSLTEGKKSVLQYVIRQFNMSKVRVRKKKKNCLKGVGRWSTKWAKVDKNCKRERESKKGIFRDG